MGLASTLDLTPEQRELILDLLKQYLPNVTVLAYGSRVKQTARPNSDLDLVALCPSELKGQVAELKEAFEESDLPFRVDLFIWDEVPEQFKKNIEQEHAVVQGKKVSDFKQWVHEIKNKGNSYR